jgi:hypothetical protein
LGHVIDELHWRPQLLTSITGLPKLPTNAITR